MKHNYSHSHQNRNGKVENTPSRTLHKNNGENWPNLRYTRQNIPDNHFICFLGFFVSLLSNFWLIHFFHLRLLYQPYLGLCQAPCVQSHQRQPMSAVAITACEVHVSAADSQTVPTVVIYVIAIFIVTKFPFNYLALNRWVSVRKT